MPSKTFVTVISRISDRQPRPSFALVEIYGTDIGRRHPVDASRTVIGRSSRADIQLDSESISRRHCELIVSDESVLLRDLGSTNGTYVDDQLVSECNLRDGDLIKVGRFIFKFLAGNNIEQAYHDEVYRLATRDQLTGLNNERSFMQIMEREMAPATRERELLSVVIIDVDHLGKINETYGWEAGDSVLQEVGRLLKNDLKAEATLAHWQGGEFVALIPDMGAEAAVAYCDAFRQLAKSRTFRDPTTGFPIPVTVSGAAGDLAYSNLSRPRSFLETVRSAVVAAKRLGRDQISAVSQQPVRSRPARQRTNNTVVPLLWFKSELVGLLRTEGSVYVVACGFADRSTLIARHGLQLVESCESELAEVLLRQAPGGLLKPRFSAVAHSGTQYLFAPHIQADEHLTQVEARIRAALAERLTSTLGIDDGGFRLHFGCAKTMSSDTSMDALINEALAATGATRQNEPGAFGDQLTTQVIAVQAPTVQSVFISYGGPDSVFAERLRNALREHGSSTWYFPDDAVPGEKIHRETHRGITNYDRVILVCSRASLTRTGVLAELEKVRQREEREGGTSVLIPIRLDEGVFEDWAPPDRKDLAREIQERVIADFTQWEDEKSFRSAVRKLVRALTKKSSSS